jgi:hypothetical protein
MLLKDHACAATVSPQGPLAANDAQVVRPHLAMSGLGEQVEATEQGGFTRTGRPEKDREAATFESE